MLNYFKHILSEWMLKRHNKKLETELHKIDSKKYIDRIVVLVKLHSFNDYFSIPDRSNKVILTRFINYEGLVSCLNDVCIAVEDGNYTDFTIVDFLTETTREVNLDTWLTTSKGRFIPADESQDEIKETIDNLYQAYCNSDDDMQRYYNSNNALLFKQCISILEQL